MSTHEGDRLKIGNLVVVNYGTQITSHSLVHLGDDCRIGQYAIIMDCD